MPMRHRGTSTEAQKNAARKYAEKVDHISLVSPKGTKEKIQAIEEQSIGSYINSLVERDLRSRHKDIMHVARARIQREIDSCKTVEDWHKAFHSLADDFKNEVLGERSFEKYVAEVLGQEAVEKFCKNITVPEFGDDIIKHIEAVDDFFEERDECAWLGDDDVNSPEINKLIHAWNTPESCACEDYKYLAHLYSAALLRSEQIESTITDLLGEEAFNRLVAQGSYEKDKLYYMAMASTKDKKRQQQLFVDWLAGRGIFAPDSASTDVKDDLKNEGWQETNKPPTETKAVLLLLADGLTRVGLYVAPEGKRRASWICAGKDYSRLVIGWQFLKKPKRVDMDSRVRRAFMDVLQTLPQKDDLEGEEAWREKVVEIVNSMVFRRVLALLGTKFPPRPEDMTFSKEVSESVNAIVTVMCQTGFCRQEQIWRLVSEMVEMVDEPRTKQLAWAVCNDCGLIYSVGDFFCLTDYGIVQSGCYHCTPSVLFNDKGVVDKMLVKHQKDVEDVETALAVEGFSFPSDIKSIYSEDEVTIADIYAMKDIEFSAISSTSSEYRGVAKQYFAEGNSLPLLVVLHDDVNAKLRKVDIDGKRVVVVGYDQFINVLSVNCGSLMNSLKSVASQE